MAELKTIPTAENVSDFLQTLDEAQRVDSQALIDIMQRITGDSPVMWGSSIIGFGTRHLKYESGRELDWMRIGFSPRKGKLAIYCPGLLEDFKEELDAIGKYQTGKGCLYIKQLADVNLERLEYFLASTL